MPFTTFGRACRLAALGFAPVLLAPGVAHAGFFEQLFGMAPQPSYEGLPSYQRAAPPRPSGMYRPMHHAKPRVAADAKPNRQKPTDLMHDASLRPGDAVMMKDGMHVFEGDRGSSHDKGDFVALDRSSEVKTKERAALAALDATRNDPLRSGAKPDTLASGRSAAVSAPVNPGFAITDARGKSVRYVGP